MIFDSKTFTLSLAVAVAPMITSVGQAATLPVTDWQVLVGSSTVSDGGTNAPTFTPANAIQIAGGFDTVTLSDQDFVEATVTVELNNRSSDGGFGTGVRLGLFREEGGGTPTAGDGEGYTGFVFKLQGDLRDHHDPTRGQPFSQGGSGAPVQILAPAGEDAEGDSVTGENVNLQFSLRAVRDGDNVDLSGSISDGDDYLQGFSLEDHTPNFNDFSWDRVGFLISGAVDAESANIIDANVTTGTIPEPASLAMCALGVAVAAGARGRRFTSST